MNKLLGVFFVMCFALLGVEFFYHRHVIHPWEDLWGFYAFYGFVVSVFLVLMAIQLRKLLMRSEDYYDRR